MKKREDNDESNLNKNLEMFTYINTLNSFLISKIINRF